jgi:hypothetical protein
MEWYLKNRKTCTTFLCSLFQWIIALKEPSPSINPVISHGFKLELELELELKVENYLFDMLDKFLKLTVLIKDSFCSLDNV